MLKKKLQPVFMITLQEQNFEFKFMIFTRRRSLFDLESRFCNILFNQFAFTSGSTLSFDLSALERLPGSLLRWSPSLPRLLQLLWIRFGFLLATPFFLYTIRYAWTDCRFVERFFQDMIKNLPKRKMCQITLY